MSRMQLDAMLRRAQNAVAANKLTQAQTICEQLIQKNPRSVSTLNLLGRMGLLSRLAVSRGRRRATPTSR